MDTPVNPFAILSFIVAPAVLTNASSVLSMSTTNRLARAVDRARELSEGGTFQITGGDNATIAMITPKKTIVLAVDIRTARLPSIREPRPSFAGIPLSVARATYWKVGTSR